VIIGHDEQNIGSVGTTGVTKGKEKKNEVKEFNMIKFCFHAFEKMGCIKQLRHHSEFLVQGMGLIDQIRNACGVTPQSYGA
jgi:hypothetical protein